MSIENDMKGWETAYSVTREKDKFRYKIAPSKEGRKSRPYIEFAIPAILLKDVPELPDDHWREKRTKNKLYILPYTRPDADISGL